MSSLAEYERELIRERTNTGLQSSRAKGKLGRRPKGYSSEKISKLLLYTQFINIQQCIAKIFTNL
ncbi:recombinase family protein [Chryseobacterium formosus]|uniref:recombinase family protein n=1 Tax=Chryseobacterium formosus TaxID=1537363 RepID=UPI002B3FFD76|nr:recombinase family protein [Chryseobacterium formosus]